MKYIDVKFINNMYSSQIKSENSYIFDSNIVMKLRNLFYNPSRLNCDEIVQWLGLIDSLRNKDKIPGYAIRELSWDFEKNDVDENKFKRILFAIEMLFSYDIKTIERIKNKEEFSGGSCPPKGNKRVFNNIVSNIEANYILLPTYCMLLKFHNEYLEKDDNKLIYKNICNFIMEELQLQGSLELILITDLLFSQNNEKKHKLESLIKWKDTVKAKNNLDNKLILKNIWNSSWDIFFLRFINALATQNINNDSIADISNPILITSDKALYDISLEYMNISATAKMAQILMPLYSNEIDYSYGDCLFVQNMQQQLSRTSTSRVGTFGQKRYNEWLKIAKDLESKLVFLVKS